MVREGGREVGIGKGRRREERERGGGGEEGKQKYPCIQKKWKCSTYLPPPYFPHWPTKAPA